MISVSRFFIAAVSFAELLISFLAHVQLFFYLPVGYMESRSVRERSRLYIPWQAATERVDDSRFQFSPGSSFVQCEMAINGR